MDNMYSNHKLNNILHNYCKIIYKIIQRVMHRMNKMKIYKMLKDN